MCVGSRSRQSIRFKGRSSPRGCSVKIHRLPCPAKRKSGFRFAQVMRARFLSGLYEWKKDGQRKHPFEIHLRDHPIMSVAGIWDTWHHSLPDERQSFSIITTAANAFMREIHDRMPLILDRSEEDAWLDPDIHGQKTLQKLFNIC